MTRRGPTDAQIAHVERCQRRIRELASRQRGTSMDEICADLQQGESSVGEYITRMVRSGDLVRRIKSRPAGRGKVVRVFVHEYDADAWAAEKEERPAAAPAPAPAPVKREPVEVVRSGYRLHLAPDPRYPSFADEWRRLRGQG